MCILSMHVDGLEWPNPVFCFFSSLTSFCLFQPPHLQKNGFIAVTKATKHKTRLFSTVYICHVPPMTLQLSDI